MIMVRWSGADGHRDLPGAVDYLLRGSDCAAHAHAGAAPQGRGHAAGAGSGQRDAQPGRGCGELPVAGAAKEPAGVWFGEGLSMLGIAAGDGGQRGAGAGGVRPARAPHPARCDGTAVPLGSRPRSFRSREDRKAQALAAEPDATEERRAEIHSKV